MPSTLPPNTVLVHLDGSQPIDQGLNNAAVNLIAREFSAGEISSRSVGGHDVQDIVNMIVRGYWPQMTKRSSVLVDQLDPMKVHSAIICIPFHCLDLALAQKVTQAIRSNDTAALSLVPDSMVQYMKADRYPEGVLLLAECDHVALEAASSNPDAAKFAKYVTHDKANDKDGQHWIEEFGLIASERDAPLGSMSGAMTILLEEMWQDGVKMAIGHYNNYSASVALRTGGKQLCKLEHRNSESLAPRPNEPLDAPRFTFIQSEIDARRGYPAESVIVHDLDELAAKHHWTKITGNYISKSRV